ncbi:phosphoribosylamine--glycine ligase [uncultured Secundilactobacillus sp.]|uniref:phosphoribosylamine--glycine ligase n=1 Tax=uncultured Secundilactobacillus sp. TaxID=2813935 RepID=UPI00258C91F4|nr:phosphoribosylamine--glycine ligase [uncultured Secundilactobacillus sp.]
MNRWLLIGNGGREYVIAQTLAKNPEVEVFVAPGNPAMADLERVSTVAIFPEEVPRLLAFAVDKQVRCTVVGPEKPLADGLVDAFRAAGLTIFGPTRQAAQLEASKVFAKKVMAAADVKTADYQQFTDLEKAKSYLNQIKYPQVLKANGLAGGKGVVIAQSFKEAETALEEISQLAGPFELLVETFLEGQEFSAFALVNGRQAVLMPLAQDHKRLRDGDEGPNTGGMGAYSPLPQFPSETASQVMTTVIQPVIDQLAAMGAPFVGFLYAGLIATSEGLKVIEFNVRMGDPETQVVLPQLQTDLSAAILTLLDGQKPRLDWQSDSIYLGTVIASAGYPRNGKDGVALPGIAAADAMVSYAGVTTQNSKWVSHGGRVMMVTVKAPSVLAAQKRVNQILDHNVDQQAYTWRHDIGHSAIS